MTSIECRRKREERHLQSRALGAMEADITRFEHIAVAFGPRTTLPNDAVYAAVWFVGMNCLAQGRPLIPTHAEQWAGEVWRHLCHVGILRPWDVGPMFELRTAAEALWSMPS